MTALLAPSVAHGQHLREVKASPHIHVKGDVTSAPVGHSPINIRRAYGFDRVANQGAGQTIAIIDAYDDPNIANELSVFSSSYGLPPCATYNGCFREVFLSGSRPPTNSTWAMEIALDVEWAHAIAPQAHILLVEVASSSFSYLFAGVNYAGNAGASVVSMSWGANEFNGETGYDYYLQHPGVTYVASSGDSGTGAHYPALSRYVVGVGGTTLNISSTGAYTSETAWSGTGGGQSVYVSEPTYQWTFYIADDSIRKRGIPDVAYDANPSTGFPVYRNYNGTSGWYQVGGTSAGAPQWAALFAIVNSERAAVGKARLSGGNAALYSAATSAYSYNYNDVRTGTNGSCGYVCTAQLGYDYVTGLGSPKAYYVIPALVRE